MSHFLTSTLSIAAFACLAPVLCGADGDATISNTPYTLEVLIDKALENSFELEELNGRIEAGRAKEEDLAWWDAPEVRLGYGRNTEVDSKFKTSEHPNHQYETALRVFPRNPWERKATQTKLESSTQLSTISYQIREALIAQKIRELYWDFSYLSAEEHLHEQSVLIHQEQVDGLEALLENGQVSITDTLPAKMKHLDSVLELDAYQRELSLVLYQLSLITGVEAQGIQTAQPITLSRASFDLGYEAWENIALENRLELKQVDGALAYTQAELKELEAQKIPWVKHLQANYEARNDYGDRDSAGVEVAITLPFFSSDDGAKRAAMSTLRSQHRQRSQNLESIRSEVRILVEQFRTLEKEWLEVATRITPLMNSLKDSIELMKQQQVQSNKNYWEAQSAILELSKKQLKQAHAYQKLLIEAERVIGEAL